MSLVGNVEIHEAGEWLAELAAFRWEISHEGKHPLLHLWSDARNLTRRLLDVKQQSSDRIVLEVQRYGHAKPGKLEFLIPAAPHAPVDIARERFRAKLWHVLEKNFPDAEIESLTTISDLRNSFSRVYVRGGLMEKRRLWAVFAVRQGESPSAVKNALTFGVLWLDWVRAHSQRPAEGLRLIVPKGTSRLLCERALGIGASSRIEIFEMCEESGRLQRMPVGEGNLQSWLIPRAERESLLNQARAAAAGVHALAVHMPPAANDITAHLTPEGREVALAFRGLEFARFSREGLFFVMKGERRKLTRETEFLLDRLMFQLDLYRNALAEDPKNPLFKTAPERWLETLVMASPERVDAQLDPRHLYSQVPAVGLDRGIVDVLGVTRRGRLVLMELKATEDLQLPMQAVDYWLRIRRHQLGGDFERYGYFPGVTLSPEPPLVWLVAPGLHFHVSAEILQRHFLPEIRMTRIGINENWRRGVRVVFRQ